MDGDPRYKMFRNFMVNELEITREDIKKWTKEAVEAEVRRIVPQTNIEEVVRNAAVREIASARGQYIREIIAKELMNKISINVKQEGQS